MPTSIPKSVREAWGEKATEDFAQWFERAVQEAAVSRDEFREVLSRLDLIENDLGGIKERLDRVDGRFAEINDRLGQIDTRLDQMNAQFNDRFDRMNEQFDARFDQMNAQFNDRFDQMNDRFDGLYAQAQATTRWAVGVIALFGTLITVLLAIAQFAS